jgi:hypothetical protein
MRDGREGNFLGCAAPRLAISRMQNAAAEIYRPFGPEKAPSRPLRIHRVLRGERLITSFSSLPHRLIVK